METDALTALQADLQPNHLGRNLKDVERVLCGCSRDGIMGEIVNRTSLDGPTVVVDAACGVGTAIEEIARIGPLLMEDIWFLRGRIRAIGIDLNPLPHLIPKSVLSLDPRTGEQNKKQTRPRAKFRRDDLRTLKTVPSGSVDVLYSVGGLHYVDDTLRALESGWRVLREGNDGRGGFMVFEVPISLMTLPDIRAIIATTRGARDVFSVPPVPNPNNDYEDKFPFIVGCKRRGGNFKGFPWRLVEARSLPAGKDDKPHYQYAVTGIYEPIKTDVRYICPD